MAKRIHDNWVPASEWTTETVETIAALPNEAAGKPERRLLSFASKFAYFFVDPSQFPLYDQYAFCRLLYHVKAPELRWKVTPRYATYVDALNALRTSCDVGVSLADLDCYLWLAGQWMVMQRATGGSAALSKEVTAAFATRTQERDEFLDTLVPH
ncbi:MAG: hypothetical protein V1750_00910 [Acidobacteriota bacterium]